MPVNISVEVRGGNGAVCDNDDDDDESAKCEGTISGDDDAEEDDEDDDDANGFSKNDDCRGIDDVTNVRMMTR
jgi:hypothetical protein